MILQEMALSRPDAMDRCYSLGIKFIEHFDKIYSNFQDPDVPHWEGEMQGWFDSIKRIKLKSTNKPLLDRQIIDWFFTATTFPEDIVDMDEDEQETYDKFCTLLLTNLSVKKSIDKIIGALL